MIKLGSVHFDQATVCRYARIRGVLEKQASAAGEAAEEVAKKGAQKFGIPKRIGEWVTAGLVLSAAGAAMGLGAQAVGVGAGKVGDAVHASHLNRDFKAMLKADPTLGGEDEKKAKQYFGILHRASPYLSGEPMLAASTVRGMMEYGHAPGDQLVKGILETEKTRQDTRHPFLKPKMPSMSTGMADVGG